MVDPDDRYSTFVAATPNPVVAIDLAGNILAFNVAAERMFGYAAAEVIGRNVSLLMPEPYRQQHDQFIQRHLQTGESRVVGIGREIEAVRKDGRLISIELSVCEIRTGSHHFFTGLMRDLSAQKAMEARFAECEQTLASTDRDLLRKCAALEREGDELRELSKATDHSASATEKPLLEHLLAGARILVVDDDRNARWQTRRVLETAGAEVDALGNGMEAIAAVSKAMVEGSPYSAVVLDLRMPVMDGHRAASEMRRLSFNGAIVIVTADHCRAQELSSGIGPVDLWLTKPVVRTQLVQGLQKLVWR